MSPDKLISLALEARKNAYAPYSGYTVGAALECTDGTVYTGCNVENASYSITCCAERTAIFKAVSEGKRKFTSIAVVGAMAEENAPLSQYGSPCGVCRQALAEFGLDIRVYGAKSPEDYIVHTISDLLPGAFVL